MDFAKAQLTKHGWKDGGGLGKTESGIKEPVKVKIKNDTKGVGHDAGEEFTFHWWDHLFNKAASNIQVRDTETGVEVDNSTSTERSKKKTKTLDNKAMLYGQFVKGATLDGGEETENEIKPTVIDESEGTKHVLMPENEEEIFKKCGGRTAHKGARHGLKLNGKLARIEEQEKLLLDKITKKNSQSENTSNCTDQSDLNVKDSLSLNVGNNSDLCSKSRKHSKKKKKKYENDDEDSLQTEETVCSELVEDVVKDSNSCKKKKKRRKRDLEEDSNMVEEKETEKTKKKKKKKKHADEES